MTFNELKKELEQAPMTWCPALIKALVEAAIAKGCFRPGGAARFVKHIEEDAPVPVRGDGIQHGVNCRKVLHISKSLKPEGWLHDSDDDRPYDVDGVSYCGRCHQAL